MHVFHEGMEMIIINNKLMNINFIKSITKYVQETSVIHINIYILQYNLITYFVVLNIIKIQ